MVAQNEALQDRRSQSYREIDTVVRSRNDTLSLYSRLASSRPFNNNTKIRKLLQKFCQNLVDYTASAHFVLYRYIDEKKERRKPILEVAGQIYPHILESTQSILDFNDKYDCGDHCETLDKLDHDLSKLGEILASRIEREDQLIDVMTAPKS